jgi:hypothetical protein
MAHVGLIHFKLNGLIMYCTGTMYMLPAQIENIFISDSAYRQNSIGNGTTYKISRVSIFENILFHFYYFGHGAVGAGTASRYDFGSKALTFSYCM